MRNFPIASQFRTLAVLAAIACLQYAAPAEAEARTWRIMPIGDSITESEGSYNSYRRPLWHMLNEAGIDIDFVGSRSGNRDGEAANPDFDTDHEGHWGWRADRFLRDNNIEIWSQTHQPDVILIHLGTNDIFQGQGVSGTIDEIGQIIDIVRGTNPRVIVLVAQIIPTSDLSRPSLQPFNEAIPDLVSSKDSVTSPVRLVDQYTGFDATVDTYDGVHPNVSGENKMAQKWFDALQPLLSADMNDAPEFTSTPVTAATQNATFAYAITTDDPDSDAVTITAPQKPEWLILVDNFDGTASLSGTPGNADVGANAVRLVVTDTSDLTAEQAFTIDVANVNDAPAFTSTADTAATEADVYSHTVTAEDPDADGLRITALTLPDWLELSDNNDGTATLIGTPGGAEVGAHTVELQAEETATAEGLAAQQSFVITVTAAPEGPEITLLGAATVTIMQGEAYSDAGATASDTQDGDLTDRITVDNPVDTSTPGTYTVTYTVEDSGGNEAQAERTVIVEEAAAPPPPPPQTDRGGGGSGAGAVSPFELLTSMLMALLIGGLQRRSAAGRTEPIALARTD